MNGLPLREIEQRLSFGRKTNDLRTRWFNGRMLLSMHTALDLISRFPELGEKEEEEAGRGGGGDFTVPQPAIDTYLQSAYYLKFSNLFQ